MLEISRILTIFLEDYRDFEVVAKATQLDDIGKNKIGIGYVAFEELLEIQGLLKHLNYDIEEVRMAFKSQSLDYINFEYWK